jgi:hypothetical protein
MGEGGIGKKGKGREGKGIYIWCICIECTAETGFGLVPCRTTKTDCRFEDIADIAGVETGYPSASARGGLGLDDTASNGEENERLEELVRLARLNVAHVWYLIHLGVTDTLTTTGKRWARGETYIYPSAGTGCGQSNFNQVDQPRD